MIKLVTTAEPIIKAIKNSQVIFLDTETKSLYPWKNGAVLAGVGVKPLDGESFYISFRHTIDVGSDNADINELHILGDALQGKTVVCHYYNFDAAVLWQEGVNIVDDVDTLCSIVMWRLISEDEPSYELNRLAKKYINPNAYESEKTMKKLMKENEWETYDLVPAKDILNYVSEDLDYPEMLYKIAMPVIEERGLTNLFKDEKKATRALFHMEREGFTSNRDWVKRRKSKLKKQHDNLRKQCYTEIGTELVKRRDNWTTLNTKELEALKIAWGLYAGYGFNIQSTHDLEKLFHALGVHSPKKTDKGGESWDKNVLKKVAEEHPLANLIVRYRTIGDVEDIYDNFLEAMDSNDIIHCSVKQAGAKTGRYSVADPPLQRIFKEGGSGGEGLSEEEKEMLYEVRGAFVPREGNFLLCADWEQIELLMMAEYADEEEIIRAFELGIDIHKLTAYAAFGELPTDPIEFKIIRDKAKALNFGVRYGMGDPTLAGRIKSTVSEAAAFRANYFKRYPKIKKLTSQVYTTIRTRLKTECKKHGELCVDWCDAERIKRGWLKNIWGRRRYLTTDEQYKGVNVLCQGTSADLMRQKNWELYNNLKDYDTMIDLPIHDEFIFDMPYTEAKECIPIIVNTMETCDKLKVPLKVDLSWAPKRWSESFSLACDKCNGHGKLFELDEDERFNALVKNDWDILNALTPESCDECEGVGYNLKKIKFPKGVK